MTTSLKTIIPLALVCSVLMGYQYLGAQWVGPSVGPTGGNVPAPVNVGTAPQVKSGPLGVAALDVIGDASVALDIAVAGTTTSDRVHAAFFCDENGQNCVDADVSLIGGGGASATGATSSTEVFGSYTMVPGWPDAIRCDKVTPTGYGYIMYLDYSSVHATNIVTYRTPASGNVYVGYWYYPDGSLYYRDGAPTSCDGKSIQQLIADGHAFSLASPMAEGGPGGYFITNRGEPVLEVMAITGLPPAGFVYSSPETRAIICDLVLPGSSPVSWSHFSYSSPSDNSALRLDSSGNWVRGSAAGYNAGINTMYCN
jgi:hypothetical protein